MDVDAVTDVAGNILGVRAMPTFYFYKGGQKVDEVVGADTSAIKAKIDKYRSGAAAAVDAKDDVEIDEA
jgi:thioredoxin 1